MSELPPQPTIEQLKQAEDIRKGWNKVLGEAGAKVAVTEPVDGHHISPVNTLVLGKMHNEINSGSYIPGHIFQKNQDEIVISMGDPTLVPHYCIEFEDKLDKLVHGVKNGRFEQAGNLIIAEVFVVQLVDLYLNNYIIRRRYAVQKFSLPTPYSTDKVGVHGVNSCAILDEQDNLFIGTPPILKWNLGMLPDKDNSSNHLVHKYLFGGESRIQNGSVLMQGRPVRIKSNNEQDKANGYLSETAAQYLVDLSTQQNV